MFFLITLNIQAKQTILKYSIGFGLFGKIGTVTASLNEDNKTYKIDARIDTSGLAASLSHNRYEIYTSEGTIVDGKLLPYKYTKLKKSKKKESIKIYIFDHQNKEVRRQTSKYEVGEIYHYYAKNDILSLFININNQLLNAKNSEKLKFKAIGAHKKDGRVNITKVSDNQFVATINQKIFSSKKGELLVTINTKGIWQKVVLKNVLLFGDIVGKIKN